MLLITTFYLFTSLVSTMPSSLNKQTKWNVKM